MNKFLEVRAKDLSTGEEKVYRNVYDMQHYWARNVPKTEMYIRLLVNMYPDGPTISERVHIDLSKNDVFVHCYEQEDKPE